MTKLIGISGKSGSNKLFYAFRLVRELRIRGQQTEIATFSLPLYGELNTIYNDLQRGLSHETLLAKCNLGEKGPELLELLSGNVGEVNPNYGLSRREESVRKALVLLGSGIRREQDPAHYIERLGSQLTGLDFAVVTDLRYPNEADFIRETGGLNIRIEPSFPEDHSGGYKYEAGMLDPTETALDDYPYFDQLYFRELFDGFAFGNYLEERFQLPASRERVR